MTIQELNNLATTIRPEDLPESYEIKIVPKKINVLSVSLAITDLVCQFTGTPREAITEKGRKLHLVRKLLVYMIRKYVPGLYLSEVGSFCNYDHGEVLKAIKVLNGWIETDEEMRNKVNDLETLIINTIQI